jgi:hypothetical protein
LPKCSDDRSSLAVPFTVSACAFHITAGVHPALHNYFAPPTKSRAVHRHEQRTIPHKGPPVYKLVILSAKVYSDKPRDSDYLKQICHQSRRKQSFLLLESCTWEGSWANNVNRFIAIKPDGVQVRISLTSPPNCLRCVLYYWIRFLTK